MGFWNQFLPLLAAGGATALTGGAAAPLMGAAEGAGALGAGALGAEAGGEALAGLSPELLGMGAKEAMGPLAPISPGTTEVMTPLSMAPDAPIGVSDTYGVGGMAPDNPIGESDITGKPGMQAPKDWQSQMKGANQALGFASKFVTHKPSRDVLNMMAMTTGMGAGVSDPTSAMSAIGEPLANLVGSAGENDAKEKQRLSQAMSPTPTPVPSSRQQPAAAPVGNASPATQRGTGALPPTRLTGDVNMMTPEMRLAMLRGY